MIFDAENARRVCRTPTHHNNYLRQALDEIERLQTVIEGLAAQVEHDPWCHLDCKGYAGCVATGGTHCPAEPYCTCDRDDKIAAAKALGG